MPSSFIKVILAFTGLSPALLILYIYRIYHEYEHLSIYIKAGSFHEIGLGIENFLSLHYLLFVFVALVIIAMIIMKVAETKFSHGRITVKSIKPADNNFVPIFTSIAFILLKTINPDLSDWIIFVCFILLGLGLGITAKTSFHYNIVLRFFFGYRHYEIATKSEVSYLMLSKTELINPSEISKYIRLADHMIVNIV